MTKQGLSTDRPELESSPSDWLCELQSTLTRTCVFLNSERGEPLVWGRGS